MSMRVVSRLLLLYCCVLVITPLLSSLVFCGQEEIFSEIVKAQRQRETMYDDGHFVWIESDASDPHKQLKKHEYWAREGRYFRLDLINLKNPPSYPVRETVIVCPERYAKFISPNTQILGAVTDFGSTKKGVSQPKNNTLVSLENRFATKKVYQLIDERNYGGQAITDLNAAKREDGSTVVTFSQTQEDVKREYEAVLSVSDYRVLSWQCRTRSLADDRWANQVVTLTYTDAFKSYPQSMLDNIQSNVKIEPLENPSTFELTEFQLEPPPIELFEIPELGPGGGFNVFVIGLSMLAFYHYYRNKKQAT